MAFEVAIGADPLFAQIQALLSPVLGIESRINSDIVALRKLTIDATNFTVNNANALFVQLSNQITLDGERRNDDVTNILDTIMQNAGLTVEDIGGPIDLAAEEARILAIARAKAAADALTRAQESIETTIETSAAESNSIFDSLIENVKDVITGIPAAILGGQNPTLDIIIALISEGDAALGGQFGALGIANALGFDALVDVMANVFRIDPQDFQDAIERVMPAIVDVSRIAGNAILEE